MKKYLEKKPLNEVTAGERAVITTALFTAFGVVGYIIAKPSPFLSLTVIFYIMILWNTYYSVNHFSGIIPPGDFTQMLVDASLVILHLLLALSLSSTFYFNLVLVLLFGVATVKYAFALPITSDPSLLYRKLKFDGLGTIASGLALVGVILGYPLEAMLSWTVLLAIMSIYIILVRPVYTKPV